MATILVTDIDRISMSDTNARPFQDLQTTIQPPKTPIRYSKVTEGYDSSDILVGIELEIENAKFDKVNKVLAEGLGKTYYVTTDGSLYNSGLEIVTAPRSAHEVRTEYHKLWKVCKKLLALGCLSHQADRCGLHVHISRTCLSEETWASMKAFLVKQKAFFGQISRRVDFNFCKFENKNQRYECLNLQPKATAEFRFFRGTLLPQSLIASIETIITLVEYFKLCETAMRDKEYKTLRFSMRGYLMFCKDSNPKKLWSYFESRVDSAKLAEAIKPAPTIKRVKNSREVIEKNKAERLKRRKEREASDLAELKALIEAAIDNSIFIRTNPNGYGLIDTTGLRVKKVTPIMELRGTWPQRLEAQMVAARSLIKVSALTHDDLVPAVRLYRTSGWGNTRVEASPMSGYSMQTYRP